jgi:IS1 family transposase
VLERPEIPLHTTGSETDVRDYVKKRKVSGGTRSDEGRRCRDTFASLKKTCRKLNISLWHYLTDSLGAQQQTIDQLTDIIVARAANAAGY